MIYSSLCIYKPSAVGQPTRPTQPFILSGSSCNQAAIIALGGSAIWCALYEVKAGVVYFAVWKLCDPCLSASPEAMTMGRYTNPASFAFFFFYYLMWVGWWLFVAVHPEGFRQRHEQFERSSATWSCHWESDGAGGDCRWYPRSATPSLQAVTHGRESAAWPGSQPGGTPHCRDADDWIRESDLQVLWGDWCPQCMKPLVSFLLSLNRCHFSLHW